MRRLGTILAAAVLLGGAGGRDLPGPAPQAGELELIKKISVPASAGWTDTGIDAAQGEEFFFRAGGEISLQRGNPEANCGPAGLDLMTVQQPLPDQNMGALIGKVAQLISVKKDEDTGEEIRDEIVAYFHIGPEKSVFVPIKGRLSLGVNENVVRDNGGEYTVYIFRPKT